MFSNRWMDKEDVTYMYIIMEYYELRELVMDREAWHATIHGVAKSWTRLSDWTELKLIYWIHGHLWHPHSYFPWQFFPSLERIFRYQKVVSFDKRRKASERSSNTVHWGSWVAKSGTWLSDWSDLICAARKSSISALLTMSKPLTVWITINYGKFWKRWEYQTTWPASWEIHMQVRKQQSELDMEQQTGSK